jgi:uncharacterized protein
MDLAFEWDQDKERANREKHGVGFSEAISVFGDPLARIFGDESHSFSERREILIGHSQAMRLLLVCFAELEDGRVRLISARRATRRERHDYEEHITN